MYCSAHCLALPIDDRDCGRDHNDLIYTILSPRRSHRSHSTHPPTTALFYLLRRMSDSKRKRDSRDKPRRRFRYVSRLPVAQAVRRCRVLIVKALGRHADPTKRRGPRRVGDLCQRQGTPGCGRAVRSLRAGACPCRAVACGRLIKALIDRGRAVAH